MKKLTNYGKMLICMALVLILSIGATIGITMTYFGDSKSGSVEIKIGASIYFDETNGVGVAVQDGTTAIVPSQSVDVTTTLLIKSSSDTNVTKGVLKVIPDLTETLEGVGLTLTDGKTYDVYLGSSSEASTSAKMVVANNALYLVKASNSTGNTSTTLNELYEITPSTSGLEVKFSVPVTFSSDINNDLSGQSCTIEMKGVVLQSGIVDTDGNDVAKTITDFEPYFTSMIPAYNVVLNEGYVAIGNYYGESDGWSYQETIHYYAVDGNNEVKAYTNGEVIKVQERIWISTLNITPDWSIDPNEVDLRYDVNTPSLTDLGADMNYSVGICLNGECINSVIDYNFNWFSYTNDALSAIVTITGDSQISFASGIVSDLN